MGLGLSAFVIWSGHSLGMGTINDPGSGYVLFYTGILMTIFSLIILYGAVAEGGPTFASRWEGTRWTKPVMIIAALLVFSLLFETLGFLISTMLLLIVTLRIIDPVRWTLAIPLAVLVPLTAWYILQKLLLIQLPSGILGVG